MNKIALAVRGAASSTRNRVAMLFAALMAMTAVSFAQTPVPLVVPTNDIFESVNTWLEVFAPIVAIGVGIAIALAILTFIGKQILQAF
jgi:uncharacterized membrane protein